MLILVNKKKVIKLMLFSLCIFSTLMLSSYNIKTFKEVTQPYFKGDKEGSKYIALTCNVDWGNEHIDSILKTLKENNTYITFMVTGRWAQKYPDELLKIKNAGHEIGNHGYKHLNYGQLSYDENYNEIKKSKDIIEGIIKEDTKFFQPPAGEYNEFTIRASKDLKYIPIKWSIDTIDWKYKDNAQYVVNRIKNGQLEDCGIMLMHPTKATSEALGEIINIIQDRGYKAGGLKNVFNVE